jgi:hypothetical protein
VIKPIQTHYNGYHFRSRLEARWAVFFDALNIEYEYEVEGFDLGNDILYLPDFWLPMQRVWFEVKGPPPTNDDSKKMIKLCYGTQTKGIIYSGQIEAPTHRPHFVRSVGFIFHKRRIYDACNLRDLPHGTTIVEKIYSWWGGVYLLKGPLIKCYPSFWWGQCPACRGFGITHFGRGWHTRCPSWKKSTNSFRCMPDTDDLQDAYRAARSARFEHGDMP